MLVSLDVRYMDNHRRIWHRLVSRLRGSRRTHSYIPGSIAGSQNVSNSSIVTDLRPPGNYSRYARDDISMRSELPITSITHWNFANSFARLGNLDNLVGFTPKCLAGFNAQSVLSGQTTYDDFSRSCWLENHLHRFGGLPPGAVLNDIGSSVFNEDSDTQLSSDNESTSSFLLNDIFVSGQRLRNNRRTGSSSTYSSSNSSFMSSRSSLSHLTHFYLAGFGLYPDPIFSDPPPPYSELHHDPPPPYTETEDSSVITSQNSTNRNASCQQLDSHDILW